MAKNIRIIVHTNAKIVEVTEGGKVPQIREVGRSEIRALAELHTDPQNNDSCYEFDFQGKTWTVDVDQVTVR